MIKRLIVLILSLCFSGMAHAQSQQTGGGGTASFSTLQPGTNSNTGTYNWTQNGVFTNAAQNDFNVFSLTAGGSCNPSNIITSGGVNVNNKVTDALTGCVATPASGTTNAFSNGVFGLAQVNDSGATGVNGWVGAVGTSGQGFCNVGTAHCWGGNFSAADKSGNTGNFIAGAEMDLQVNNNSTTGFGALVAFQGNGQPTADNFPGFAVNTPSGTGKFTTGFECKDGSTNQGSSTFGSCLSVGQGAAGSAQSSQFVLFQANTGAGTIQKGIQLRKGSVLQTGAIFSATGFAANWTSTASLSANQLVKIDSAHNDSFVICTTTDTQCQGIVGETVSDNCTAAGTTCPIITVPGSKAQGILGTGTCAVDNPAGTRSFVVVDTTTNGDVKCTSTQPAVGAYIGLAISSQNTVGQLVDILTKFQ